MKKKKVTLLVTIPTVITVITTILVCIYALKAYTDVKKRTEIYKNIIFDNYKVEFEVDKVKVKKNWVRESENKYEPIVVTEKENGEEIVIDCDKFFQYKKGDVLYVMTVKYIDENNKEVCRISIEAKDGWGKVGNKWIFVKGDTCIQVPTDEVNEYEINSNSMYIINKKRREELSFMYGMEDAITIEAKQMEDTNHIVKYLKNRKNNVKYIILETKEKDKCKYYLIENNTTKIIVIEKNGIYLKFEAKDDTSITDLWKSLIN